MWYWFFFTQAEKKSVSIFWGIGSSQNCPFPFIVCAFGFLVITQYSSETDNYMASMAVTGLFLCQSDNIFHKCSESDLYLINRYRHWLWQSWTTHTRHLLSTIWIFYPLFFPTFFSGNVSAANKKTTCNFFKKEKECLKKSRRYHAMRFAEFFSHEKIQCVVTFTTLEDESLHMEFPCSQHLFIKYFAFRRKGHFSNAFE